MHMSKFTTRVLLLRLCTPDCKLSGDKHDAPAHHTTGGLVGRTAPAHTGRPLRLDASHGGPVRGGPAWPGVPGVCVGPGGRDGELEAGQEPSRSGSGGGGAGPARGQVSGWPDVGPQSQFPVRVLPAPWGRWNPREGVPEEIQHQERAGRPDRRIVLGCAAAAAAARATGQPRAGDRRYAAGKDFQLCKLLESCSIFPGRLSLLDVMSCEEGKELRTWEEELTWAALQQKNLEELLQHKGQELAEWEIDILEWELNIILHQLCQEKPRLKKSMGKFRKSCLKLKDSNHISLPSGQWPGACWKLGKMQRNMKL
ncbi:uncharacterized protein LOC143657236 [Tamandua tetradactyla]|uniref:uncharacterized protein LOC143657236 n=1 Tax=Tamandua tetradactyla TaxID=48850 RepID=UPI0040539B4C